MYMEKINKLVEWLTTPSLLRETEDIVSVDHQGRSEIKLEMLYINVLGIKKGRIGLGILQISVHIQQERKQMGPVSGYSIDLTAIPVGSCKQKCLLEQAYTEQKWQILPEAAWQGYPLPLDLWWF